MKAIVYNSYGSPDVLHLQEVAEPTLAHDHVLVVLPVGRDQHAVARSEAGQAAAHRKRARAAFLVDGIGGDLCYHLAVIRIATLDVILISGLLQALFVQIADRGDFDIRKRRQRRVMHVVSHTTRTDHRDADFTFFTHVRCFPI